MNYKTRTVRLLPFVIIAVLFSLVSCTQTQQTDTAVPIPVTGDQYTQTPSIIYVTQQPEVRNAAYTMKSGTQLQISPLTNVQVIKEPGSSSDLNETIMSLSEGKMVIQSSEAGNAVFTVQNPKGVSASLTGCAMAVSYDSAKDTFEMYCINGECQLKMTSGMKIGSGKYLVVNGNDVQPAVSFDAAAFKEKFHTDMPVCKAQEIPVTGGESATSTPIPTVKANTAATATAACAAFKRKFPATPCP
jgi:lipopolysaccharide export system protein LptA